MAKHATSLWEVEYKAWWAIKRLNMDLIRAREKSKEQILATQAQHTAILRQISIILTVHQLLSIPFPPHPEPPTGEAAEPSFQQHHYRSLRRYHFLPIFQSLLSH
ncbi:hypothetical protein CK203_027932 [Vitis vinifera]|uniref:Uncharacterized protein n=1 Tax=Vitis vinifera TaxID=29760 RepID=A0A438J3E7_VITVI|nr:hypothetical protein CK203_027932 [Vitis vinifera]